MWSARKSASHAMHWLRAAATAMAVIFVAGHLQQLAAQEETIRVPQVTISLVRQSDIPARDAGVLSTLDAFEGKPVVKGEVVAVLENDEQALALAAAQLNLKVAVMRAQDDLPVTSAAAQLRESQSGKTVKEVALQIAETEASSEVAIDIASAETRLRQLELERANNARTSFKGSISAAQIDRLKTAVQQGELEIQRARHEFSVLKMKPAAERAALQQKVEEISRYKALLEQEQQKQLVAEVNEQVHDNDVAMAKLQLEHRNIRAPFDGVIVKVEKHVGEWVEPGAAIARVIDLKSLRAEGFLQGNQATANLTGRPVSILVSSGGEEIALNGKVTFVSPEVDPVNQQVRFYAEFDNSQLQVRPGMNASLVIKQ